MTNLKLTSKMHIFIAVSSVLIAIGIAVGIICQFLAGGWFNYGSEYSSYNSVVVEYAVLDYSDEESVKTVCDEAFKAEGVNYYNSVYGTTGGGGRITFQFSAGTDAEKIQAAAASINASLNTEDSTALSNAEFHEAETLLGGANVIKYAAIAVSAAAAFQFLYFVIRYRLTMAFAALLADVHNLALFVALLTITRLPIGSYAVYFGVLTVLITMIGCAFLFGNIRGKLKDENFAKLSVSEQIDACAGECLMKICVASIAVSAAAVLMFVLLSISSLSVNVILAPAVLAIISSVSAVYGTAFFTPSVYSRFKRIADDYKAAHSKKSAKKS